MLTDANNNLIWTLVHSRGGWNWDGIPTYLISALSVTNFLNSCELSSKQVQSITERLFTSNRP